jgi:hypothetical protein
MTVAAYIGKLSEALGLAAVSRKDVAVMRSMRNSVAAGSVDLREANRVAGISASLRVPAGAASPGVGGGRGKGGPQRRLPPTP